MNPNLKTLGVAGGVVIAVLVIGAIISGGKGDAASKIAAMEEAGITVSPSPSELGKTLKALLEG